MKKTILTLAFKMIMAGIIFNGCQSSEQKVDAAEEKFEDARQNLEKVHDAADQKEERAVNEEEWKIFRDESELEIRKNEIVIAKLNAKIRKPGKTFDAANALKVDELEQENKDLEARMNNYKKSETNWEAFRQEFKHDMEEIGKSLKDLGVDNRK